MVKYALILFMVFAASFATVVTSGDAGKQFAEDTAAEQCDQPNVEAVYICNGNVVRVVSSIEGEGSTFYNPDGRVTECPDVSPAEMGALCVQMMLPNYCPEETECGASDAAEVFPGQSDTESEEPQQNTSIEQENEVDAVSDEDTDDEDLEMEVVLDNTQPETNDDGEFQTTIVKTGAENPLGFLLPVVVLLGVAAVIVLFLLFKNSIHHDV
jgi:hypothetical protein